MRILAIDYGQKRIGVAISDPSAIIAQPLTTLASNDKGMKELEEITHTNEVSKIVLGYPRLLNGDPSTMCEHVEAFAKQLGERINIPIEFWDERLTTSQSERVLIEGNVRRKDRKKVRDKVAAVLILQNYLDSQSQSYHAT